MYLTHRSVLVIFAALVPALAAAQSAPSPTAAPGFTMEQVKSYPFPNELTGATKANRIAWACNERGVRNVYVAEGPDFTARRLTSYTGDEAQELTSVQLSPDGSRVIYVRGGDHGSNWDDALPVNPTGATTPVKVQIWTILFAGGAPKSLGEGDSPVISPRGDRVAFDRKGQIFSAPIDGSSPAKALFTARGTNGGITWSPDGARLAFVSSRGDYAFVGIYTAADTPITWIAPSTNRDDSPRWSPDGTRLVFVRRPGAGGPPQPILDPRPTTRALWTASAATGEATLLWTSPKTPRGSVPTTHGGTNLHWAAAGRIVFLSYLDGWPHLYSIGEHGGKPRLLTPGSYMAEYIRLSPDRRMLVFAGNAGTGTDDIDRRHVVSVPVDRAEPKVLTPGTGLEWTPVILGDGATVAYLGATAQRPPLPVVQALAGGSAQTIAADLVPADFPSAQLVTPRAVTSKAEDGLVVHAQLFERTDIRAARKPAIVYVHGGPPRQMLLGWHYSDYYANAYAMNQYLASRGFVVLSVNYRLGIGYGHEFHRPPAAGARGASEYLDVKAAAVYLRGLPQADGKKIGIYGGSYGGFLTALALGRNSDLFAAGVDIHGVHDFTAGTASSGLALPMTVTGSSKFEPNDRDQAFEVAWKSSPVSWVAQWKSPVLFIHADDDRNVRFSQTVDLVRRVAERGIDHEEMVIVDDTHHWMRHANQLRVNTAIASFLEKKLRHP
ncbi:MAG: S9 family peptidase [Opitutus sp.]|nr:S9 family peptidase [Opitutus sp.]